MGMAAQRGIARHDDVTVFGLDQCDLMTDSAGCRGRERRRVARRKRQNAALPPFLQRNC